MSTTAALDPVALRDALAHPLVMQREILNKMLATLSPKQMTHQPCAGGNHALWIMGHLAWADDLFLSAMGGAGGRLGEEWMARFGWKTEISGDAASYPSLETVRSAFAERRAALHAWWSALDPARLGEAVEGDLAGFAPTIAVLPGAIAGHEAMHVGQTSVIRKSLGMEPVMA